MINKLVDLVPRLYRHHFIRYLVVGGSTFVIDFGLLVLLHGRQHVRLEIATSISYWAAVVFNFSLNRWWTFSAGDRKSLRKHVATYGVLLAANYLFTLAFVSIVSQHINYAIAKILAIPIQMTWTYFVYKHVIFTSSSESTKEKSPILTVE